MTDDRDLAADNCGSLRVWIEGRNNKGRAVLAARCACGWLHMNLVDQDTETIQHALNHIQHALNHIRRATLDVEARHQNAAEAGAALAAVVYAYLEDPEGVGTDALRDAYGTFMALHSGGFHS